MLCVLSCKCVLLSCELFMLSCFFVVAVKRLFHCCVRFETATLKDDLIVFNYRLIKSWKKLQPSLSLVSFSFPQNDGQPLGEPRSCSSAQTWGQSWQPPLAAASSRQLNVTDFPTRDVMTSVSGRHCNCCQDSLAEDLPFFFFAVGTADICADFTTSRALDSRRHMVADWVDWHRAASSLMPTGLGLQMSLSLMKGRKKERSCWAHLPLLHRSAFLNCFHLIGNNHDDFHDDDFDCTLLWHPICLFNAQLPISLSFTALCSILFLPLSLRRWEQNWASVIPIKKERVGAKYSPPSVLPV